MRDRDAGDVEVLQRSQRLDAVVALGGHFALAEGVVFKPGVVHVQPPKIFHTKVTKYNTKNTKNFLIFFVLLCASLCTLCLMV